MDFVVANGGVVRIPDGVPFEQAAFVEPVNTVLKGVKLLNLAPDDTVLVIGQGPIGLMHAVLASRIAGKGADLGSVSRAARDCGAIRPASIQSMPAPKMWSSEFLPRRRPRSGRRGSGRRR